MKVRPVEPQDKESVIRLVASILQKEFPQEGPHYATDDLERLELAYANPSHLFLVAEEGQEIIGTCGVKADSPHTAILRRLFVDARYRRKGVGRKLLQGALDFCKKRRFKKVVIRTSARMERATQLCQSLGFQEEGRWDMGGVTLVQLQLRLP